MDRKNYQEIFDNEENHWWYRSQRNKVDSLIKEYTAPPYKILDAGCGTGFGMVYFRKYGDIYGIDRSEIALEYCRKRGLTNVQLSGIRTIPFPEDEFNLILCLDVLCYLEDKEREMAVEELYRVTSRGGSIILTVPAFDILSGPHDETMGVKNRFSTREVRSLLSSKGFEIMKMSYVYLTLFLPLLVRRKLGKLGITKASDLVRIPGYLDKLLYSLAEIDTQLFKYFDLPIGSSVLCLARKK